AATTAEALCEHAVRVAAARNHIAGCRQTYCRTGTAAVAGAAESEARARSVADATSDGEAAVAAATADALREYAVRVIARGVDERRSVVQRNQAACAAPAAETLREHAVRIIAVRDHRRAAVEQDVTAEAAAVTGATEPERCSRAVRDTACDGEATVATATADALRGDAIGVTALRFDRRAG